MKTITGISVSILSIGLLVGCGNQAENNSTIEELKNTQTEQVQEVEHSIVYLDSINKLSNQIGELKTVQETKRMQIDALTKKKDSVTNALKQIQQSLEQVNAKKIAPGIEGVNTKLAELKGQRENAQEQLELQKQEIVLAEKKIDLLKEEKTVYDAQYKALYAKGAAPIEFKEVNALLAGLNGKIGEQVLRVKSLKSTIAEVSDQITSIDEQRKSLSNKIRNNYTAKEIFDDYSKEEKDRLEAKLKVIEDKLMLISSDDASISNLIASQNSKKSAYENEQTAGEELTKLNEQQKLNEARIANEKAIIEKSKTDKKGKKNTAILIVGILAGIFLLLFLLGKMRKSKSKKTK